MRQFQNINLRNITEMTNTKKGRDDEHEPNFVRMDFLYAIADNTCCWPTDQGE